MSTQGNVVTNLISIQPMQWARMPELLDTPPIDLSDVACMSDIRDVLARHGKLRRFALHLAHSHFKLEAGEVLIERPDPDGRTQHVTVGLLSDEPEARPTTWLFDDLQLSGRVYCVCQSDPVHQAGCVRHGHSNSPPEKDQVADMIKNRRISEENALYERGFPIGGHDHEEDYEQGI